MRTNISAAQEFARSQRNGMARTYAEVLINQYTLPTDHLNYPCPNRVLACGDQLNNTTERRIAHTIRHYCVGDCDLRGNRIDANGKRV